MSSLSMLSYCYVLWSLVVDVATYLQKKCTSYVYIACTSTWRNNQAMVSSAILDKMIIMLMGGYKMRLSSVLCCVVSREERVDIVATS